MQSYIFAIVQSPFYVRKSSCKTVAKLFKINAIGGAISCRDFFYLCYGLAINALHF